MKILVTGAAGFIGSHLCEKLVEKHKVTGLDNLCDFYDPEIKRSNLEKLEKCYNFEFVKLDIRDHQGLKELFSRIEPDTVIHLAAMAGVRPSLKDPLLYEDVNIKGTLKLLEICAEYGIGKFIFASSSSVYGNNLKLPFSEADDVNNPISPYAYTKKTGELICHTYHHLYRISVVCLRFFTVYGPRQRPDLAISKFAHLMLEGRDIPVFGDGTTERDYTYISDIVQGIEKATAFCHRNNTFEIFNLGESRTVSLNRMIEILEKYTGIRAKRNHLPPQPGDMIRTWADLSKSRKVLGYNPQIDFEQGIELFINWLRSEKSI